MAKILLPKRFDTKDIARWQKIANKETRGNLSLWMELSLNKTADKILNSQNKKSAKNQK